MVNETQQPATCRWIAWNALKSLQLAALCLTVGCSQPAIPEAPADRKTAAASHDDIDFARLLARFEDEARARSTDESRVTIKSVLVETDTRKTIAATRSRSDGTTHYTLEFERPVDRWICSRATALEVDSQGGKSEHSLRGEPIEIDQLLIWLAW